MTRGETVGIAGAGAWGTALAQRVASTGRAVLLWSHDAAVVDGINARHASPRGPASLPPSLRATADPRQLAASARLLVIAVPSTQVRARARELGDHVDGSHLVVHAVGALADDRRVSEVLREELPARRIGVLAGPALARDLADGQFASMVIAAGFDEVLDQGRRLLAVPPILRIYRSQDLAGVELAAAITGAHTVALGLADGLGVGPGTRAVLVTRAIAEAARLGAAAGAEARTFSGLAGLGNLLVRASAGRDASADYQLGLALAKGVRPDGDPTEGARAATAGVKLAARLGIRVPILAAVEAVLHGKLGPADAANAVAETVAAEE